MNKNVTPGPGQYQAASLATEIQQKVGSRSQGGFGSSQNRFIADPRDQLPGPG